MQKKVFFAVSSRIQNLKIFMAVRIIYNKFKKGDKMIVVREVFYLKFGAAKPALELIKKSKELMQKFSMTPMKTMTDFTGHSYTLVLESEYESLSAFEKDMQSGFSNEEWQVWYEKFKPLVNSSFREIYKVVA
jgi:hypothetical protein